MPLEDHYQLASNVCIPAREAASNPDMQQFVETESSRLTQLLSIHAHGRLHVLLTKELLVAAGGLSGKGAVLRLVLGFACGSAEAQPPSPTALPHLQIDVRPIRISLGVSDAATYPDTPKDIKCLATPRACKRRKPPRRFQSEHSAAHRARTFAWNSLGVSGESSKTLSLRA